VQRFCRHNRFVERCPICRESVPGAAPAKGASKGGTAERSAQRTGSPARRSRRVGEGVRVYSEGPRRGEDDGYRSGLLPGLHSSHDALALAEELAFAHSRLLALATVPPGMYGEAGELEDLEQATWTCFLIAYLSPTEEEDPFAGIREALAADWRSGELPDLDGLPLGPRTSHDPARGSATLSAYLQWAERAGSQARAFAGDESWSPPRRFERLFERLTFPGFGRMGRYELLVTLGRLGLYELEADALHLAGVRGATTSDHATVAAKRVFGIGDPMILERRAAELAQAVSVSIETLDLALANWGVGTRASMGCSPQARDEEVLARARAALDL
jgi:Alpha-glutamyl/putrescinyl thymine pyrophosphorylase clade 3